jgi:hypothetical protein
MTCSGSPDIVQSISKISKLGLARSPPILRRCLRFLGRLGVLMEGIWSPKIVGNGPGTSEIWLWQTGGGDGTDQGNWSIVKVFGLGKGWE